VPDTPVTAQAPDSRKVCRECHDPAPGAIQGRPEAGPGANTGWANIQAPSSKEIRKPKPA